MDDKTLRNNVLSALAAGEVGGINVDVRHGEVILSGAVRTWFDRDLAERTTWTVPGVRALDNRLEIKEDGAPADAEFIA